MERAPRQPRLGLRGPGWAAAGAVLLGLVGASAARSDPDFGTLGFDRGEFGSVVSLSTPSSRLYQEADEFVIHRTVVQSLSSVEPGLIQAGVYRSGPSIELDNCGTSAGYVVFSEVKAQGSMAYRCQLFQTVAPGRVVTLDVFRFRAAATWGIRIDGRFILVHLPARLQPRAAGHRVGDRGRRLQRGDAHGDAVRAGRPRTVEGLHDRRAIPPSCGAGGRSWCRTIRRTMSTGAGRVRRGRPTIHHRQ